MATEAQFGEIRRAGRLLARKITRTAWEANVLSTFNWLLIGHLIGDWVLQSDWMASGKRRNRWNAAGTAHYTIYSAVVLSALWLSGIRGQSPAFYLCMGAMIFGTHWFIDGTHLIDRWMQFCGQGPDRIVRLMVDQTFHIVVLAVAATLS